MARERKVSVQSYVLPNEREDFIKACGDDSPSEVIRAFIKAKVAKYKKEIKS